jgi:hypothetical protein
MSNDDGYQQRKDGGGSSGGYGKRNDNNGNSRGSNTAVVVTVANDSIVGQDVAITMIGKCDERGRPYEKWKIPKSRTD